MSRRYVVLFPIFIAACGQPGTSDHSLGLAHPGPWDIPAGVLASGDQQYVSYTGAGPWVGEDGCGGRLLDGTRVLRDFLYEAFPQVFHIGGYACRRNTGNTSQMSVHGTGRALDIHIPLDAGDADNDLGDPVGNWLIENAEQIGIQYIIWDRWTWGAARTVGAKERSYGGPHPHHDHLHVELSPEAAAMETPWFSSGMPPPPLPDCGRISRNGGVVDDTSECFTAYGPAEYWRTDDERGYGGGLIWTNAFENERPSNWARWHLDVEEAGEYEVSIFVDDELGVHRATRYSVTASASETTVVVDQSAGADWVSLGTFEFAAGAGQFVEVFDDSSEPVEADQHIVVDAVRLVPTRFTPVPEPPIDERVELDDPDVEIKRPPSIIGPDDPSPPSKPADPQTNGVSKAEGCRSATGGSGWIILLLPALLWVRRR